MKGGLVRHKTLHINKNSYSNKIEKSQPNIIEQLNTINTSNIQTQDQDTMIQLSPADHPLEPKNQTQKDKHHYCIEINNLKIYKDKNIVEPITGKAIFKVS